MAPRKINFSGLPALVQNLVISKLEASEVANLGAASREMRAAVAGRVAELKRERAELFRKLPEILGRPFRNPAAQHMTLGKYTISTTEARGAVPFYFHATVASEDMSVQFCFWASDIRFLGRPVISQTDLMIFGKKKRFVPKFKKYDSIRKEIANIKNCLRLQKYDMV